MPETIQATTYDWDGDGGDRWAANLDRLNLMLKTFGEAALAAAAPQPGERVLDVGCGSGTSTFAIAQRIGPDGHALGVDISQQLIERARTDTPPGAPVAFLRADAAIATISEPRFDLLFSRFGVMFFDDPTAAFTHMRDAVKAGGRLAFVCWRGVQENDWVRVPMTAIRDLVPPITADPNAPGPFAFGDRNRLESILSDAGFVNIDIAPFDSAISYGQGDTRDAAIDDALDMAFAVGPLSRALADQPEDVRSQAAKAVRAAFAHRPGETSIQLDGAVWIVTARNPA